MIACDECTAWQHNDCMEVLVVPETYYCEQCRPDLHADLLARVERGEKPWEERAKERERQAEELRTKKKRGGKRGGRKSAKSGDIKPEAGEDANGTGTPMREAPVPEDKSSVKPTEVIPGSGQKRKAEETEDAGKLELVRASRFNFQHFQSRSNEQQEPKKAKKAATPAHKDPDSKNGVAPPEKRKSSIMAVPSRQTSKSEPDQPGLVGSLADLTDVSRKRAAESLTKLFVDQISTAQKTGSFTLTEGETRETIGTKLGLAIEHALYQNRSGGDYNAQFRTIIFNVKKNSTLRDRLLVGSLSPVALSMMSTEDMASKELQQITAQMKKDADKQAVLVPETGTRIRRTHKGEELVGEESQHVSEPVFTTNMPRRRESVMDDDAQRETSAGSMSPRSPVFHDGNEFHDSKPKPHAIDTKAPPAAGVRSDRRSSSNFNIDNVWSSVQSPDTDKHPASRHVPGAFREPPSTANVQPDDEIDQLLKDEDNESEPYSPREFSEEGVLWHGKLAMTTIAEFSAFAKFAGGANLSNKISWSQLLPPTLPIDGRIDIERASKYLCGLRFSQTTDISVVSVSAPENAKDREQFGKLFSYFAERKRYGVVGKHPLPAVKDTYIIPVETGEGTKPEFLNLLENNIIQDPNPERLILVAFVIKSKDPSSASATPRQPDSGAPTIGSPTSAVRATPSMQQPSQYSPLPAYNGQNSPPQPPAYPSPSQHQLPFSPHVSNYQPQSPPPMTGLAAAAHVLGPMAKAPAVEALLKQVPNASVFELTVVRDVLMNVPTAANDLNTLTEVLKSKRDGG
jgi:hypothetical protein